MTLSKVKLLAHVSKNQMSACSFVDCWSETAALPYSRFLFRRTEYQCRTAMIPVFMRVSQEEAAQTHK